MVKFFILQLLLSVVLLGQEYDIYVFHKLPDKKEMTYIFDDSKTNKDLEYEFYKERLKDKLSSKNFIENSANPDFTIEFTYGILGQEIEQKLSFESFFGTTISNTMTKKYFYLYMFDKKTKAMMYQSKIISEDVDQDDFFDVYDTMLKKLFEIFPGENGKKVNR